MDPLLVTLLRGVQALPPTDLTGKEAALLLAFLGQDLEGVLETLLPQGARIRFDQGPVVTAQGSLPFPEGTRLIVRVQAAPEGGVQLQTLQARPPASPEVLAPLLQGEAMALLARLSQPDPALAPLQALLRQILGPPVEPEAQVPPNPIAPTPDPGPANPGPAQPQAPAPAVSAPPQPTAPPAGTPAMSASVPVPTPEPAPTPTAPSVAPAPAPTAPLPAGSEPVAPAQAAPAAPEPAPRGPSPDQPQVLQGLPAEEVRTLARVPGLPTRAEPAEVADAPQRMAAPDDASAPPQTRLQPLRAALPELPAPTRAALAEAPQVPQPDRPALAAPRPTAPALVPSPPPTAAAHHPAAEARTWEAWLREGTRVLADPVASPREAPFHALQGLERTGFFELPIPWLPTGTLHLWAEWDDSEQGGAPAREGGVVRLLVGVAFSGLGETRIGLERAGNRLSVRVWAEHPELLQSELEPMTQELGALGIEAQVQVLPLPPDSPTLRALAGGTAWEALG
jgi:hypothetical protein